MKMAKPSERDIDAAGDLISLLLQLDRGDYPTVDEDADVPDWFDEDDPKHLRAFYDAMKATLDKAPGYPGRVIGGMCYVIMYDKNEIIDPNSDVIDLHPKLAAAQLQAERYGFVRTLHPCEFEMLVAQNIAGVGKFDDLVDHDRAARAALHTNTGEKA
jgi:hypothetical protein